jgi:N-methylhydantoinase A
LHAVALARELGIPEVLVPARPGLTNALGCLVADLRQDRVNTLNRTLDGLDMAEVRAGFDFQRDSALGAIAEERTEVEAVSVLHGADMQFRGQTHLIRVPLPRADVSREEVQSLFEAAYFKRFQVRLPEVRAVLVNLVTSAIGRRRPFPLAALLDRSRRRATLDEARIGRRPVYADASWHEAPVFAREALPDGARIEGPAVVQQIDATTVVEPGAVATVDAIGNLRIRA